jgi:hypothetical protein
MIPWERDMYIGMVNNWVKDETERIKKNKLESQENLRKLVAAKNRNKR